ncbi:DUF3237 domain-containing protein [Rhizobium sp. AQ_MP]|uniref:DUF3237 domain-containing protein n=1 Tax=Rhizobium sp. AQ_MP TaxID=2761536 RepID=UPI00163AA3D2|nr:DUF3237 domain-containing protein [Rhizobium sp. AQ_MP]MBC2771845.1 DUF3237 domain-containing protein [Rhizobium sp. AQ_MP]
MNLSAQDLPVPVEPALEFAFRIEALIAPALVGEAGRNGVRRITPITGGTVSGPALNGTVISGGADYETVRADGNSIVEAHYALQADDGTVIYILNKGIMTASPEAWVKINANEPVAPEGYYFRCTPVFDAPEGPHVWLSDHIFVASCAFTSDRVIIDVYRCL